TRPALLQIGARRHTSRSVDFRGRPHRSEASGGSVRLCSTHSVGTFGPAHGALADSRSALMRRPPRGGQPTKARVRVSEHSRGRDVYPSNGSIRSAVQDPTPYKTTVCAATGPEQGTYVR